MERLNVETPELCYLTVYLLNTDSTYLYLLLHVRCLIISINDYYIINM